MDTQTVFDELVKIQSWPGVGLVFALCIVAGYLFKFWKNFPNAAIPTVVVIMGAVFNLLLAGQEPAGIPGGVWHTRQFIAGIVVGFIAWLSHNLVISKVEDWVSLKIPSVGTFLSSKSQPPTTPPAP